MKKTLIYFLILSLFVTNISYCQTKEFFDINSFDKAIENSIKTNAISIYCDGDDCDIESLPEGIEDLANLSYIYLSGFHKLNLIETFTIFSQLPKLDTLILNDCGFERLGPEIGLLSNIKYLELDGYRNNSLPKEIGNLKYLKHLEINYSSLTSLPKEIGDLKNLEYLRIYSNHNTISIPDEFCNLLNLRILDFNKTNIKSIPQEIGNLINLEELNPGNKIVEVPPSIGNIKKLKFLDISDTQIKSLPIEFYNLTNLEYLDLSNNKLSSIDPLISNFKNLRYLDISRNVDITLFDFDLSAISTLKTLNLSNTKISFIPVEFVNVDSIEKISICPTIYKDIDKTMQDFGAKIDWVNYCRVLERNLVNFKEIYGKQTTVLEESQDTLFAKYSYLFDYVCEEYKEYYTITITNIDSIQVDKIYTIPNTFINVDYSYSSCWYKYFSDEYSCSGYLKFIEISEEYIKCFINISVIDEDREIDTVLYKLLEFRK